MSNFAISSLPQGRGIGMLIGCLVALWIANFQRDRGYFPSWLISPRTRSGLLIFIAALIILLSSAQKLELIDEEGLKRWFIPIFDVGFALMIVGISYGWEDWFTKALTWSPIAYIGKISYGIYLYHMFAQYLTWHVLLEQIETWPNYIKYSLRLLVYGGLSVGIAALSYHFYEKKFLKLKETLRV